MNFLTIYRISLYVMLFLASLVLTFETSGETSFALLHPALIAASCIGAFVTVDRRPELGLDRGLANTLAIATAALVLLESWSGVNLAMAMGYWLVYLTAIKVFLPKTAQDDWYLFLLGLVQVVIGAFIGQSDQTGMLLMSWAGVTLWCLGLFYLHREALRAGPGPGATMLPAPDRLDPYPGLIDRPFVVASILVGLLTLVLGGFIFLATPRWQGAGSTPRASGVTRHYAGFSESVRLGQIGEILENDALVMSIELFDHAGNKIQIEEPLWRGVVLTEYDGGRWSRYESRATPISRYSTAGARVITQRVKLQPTDSPVLFALRPIFRVSAGREEVNFGQTDGTISRNEVESRAFYEYEVVSAAGPLPDGQPGEQLPLERGPRGKYYLGEALLDFPIGNDGLAERIRAIAEPIVRDIPEDDIPRRAKALESYLRDNPAFRYSLSMTRTSPEIDPVEDFLVNRKEGHCEYYASALALLLRSIGIPSRLINGFKGGDWNDLGKVYLVRQKHAHSWVEALADPEQFQASWITLDPTPPQRDVIAAQVGGVPPRLRSLSDFFRYIWIFFIVGYNSDRQKLYIYEPARRLMEDAANGFTLMWIWIKTAFGWLLHFEDVGDFFSVRGFFVSIVVMLLLVALLRVGVWVYRRFLRAARPDRDGDAKAAGVAFYRRLSELLNLYGLRRPPGETPREFARRAALFLAGRDGGSAELASLPAQVVDAFYRIRFGHQEIEPETLATLEARLDTLEASLKPRA